MRLLIFVLGITLLGPTIASLIKGKISAWEVYKLKYDKLYSTTEEDRHRMKIYYHHLKKVVEHNKKFEEGLVSYKTKLNRFADMKAFEVAKLLNGYNRSLLAYNGISEIGSSYIEPEFVELAPQVDWRTKGAVTPIKDQGQCGSCWAFSSTGSLEGQHFRKTGKLVSLSEQNLVDCSSRFGNNGCEGGLMDRAFKYIKQNHGIDTETSYPYIAEDEVCKFNKRSIGATDNGYVDIQSGNEKKLMSAVATIGPISVAIDASHGSFQAYKSGIYYEPLCSSTQLDHGVLVVGYGTENGKDYWIVKNSWGDDWGDSGYIKMARNHGNNCGIATAASYPLV